MRIRAITILTALLAATITPVGAAQTSSWDQHRFDETHQGFVPHNVNSVFGAPTVEWWANRSIPATVKASPIYAEGRVFIGAWDNKLYALDSESGSALWNFDAKSKITGAAAASESSVYVVTEGGILYLINAKTGVAERQVSAGATFGSPTVHERRVYIGTNAGSVVAYDGDTLQQVWSFSTAGSFMSGVIKPVAGRVEGAVAVYNGLVIFGSENQYLYAVNEQGTGDDKTFLVGLFKATGAIRSSPAIDRLNNRAIFGAQDGKLYAVQLPSSAYGTPANMTSTWTHAQVTSTNLPSQIQSSPAIAYGNVYFGANNGNIVAVTLTSGTEVWKKTTAGQVVSSPAVANHTVAIGSSDRSLYLLNATTGEVLWSRASSSAVESSPAIHGSQAFWANTDGALFSWGGPKPARADLSIVSITGSLVAGESGSVAVNVKNVGTLASPATEVQFFSTDARGTAAKLLTTEDLPAMEPGAQRRVTASYVAAAGANYLRVVIDPANVVKEVDKGNNVKDQRLNAAAPATDGPTTEGGAPGLEALLIVAVIGAVAFARRRRA